MFKKVHLFSGLALLGLLVVHCSPIDPGTVSTGDAGRDDTCATTTATCPPGTRARVLTDRDTSCRAGAICQEIGKCRFECLCTDGATVCEGDHKVNVCQNGVFVSKEDCSTTGSVCKGAPGTAGCDNCPPAPDGRLQKRCGQANVCTYIWTVQNCGDCDKACPTPNDTNASPVCERDVGCKVRCADGYALQPDGKTCLYGCPTAGTTPCTTVNGVQCIDLAKDPLHCGQCNKAAPADPTAPNSVGMCASGLPYVACKPPTSVRCGMPAKCTNTANDVANCGVCNKVCSNPSGSTSCNLGACEPICNVSHATCDGNPDNGCEANATQDTSCGSNCAVCAAATACTSINGTYSCATCEQRGLVTCGDTCVEPFLAGYAYRAPIPIANGGNALVDFQVRFTINTSALIAANKLKASAADLRVTTGNGTTTIPFWVSPTTIDSATTTVWARVPAIPSGDSKIYVYYGNAAAADASDYDGTFVTAINNARFMASAGWAKEGPSNGAGVAQFEIPGSSCGGAGCFELNMSRGPNPNGDGVSACQTITLPGGSNYRLVFDVYLGVLINSQGNIMLGATGVFGSGSGGGNQGTRVDVFSASLPPQVSKLCVGGYLERNAGSGQQNYSVWRNLRLVRSAAPEPSTGAIGAETAKCL